MQCTAKQLFLVSTIECIFNQPMESFNQKNLLYAYIASVFPLLQDKHIFAGSGNYLSSGILAG